MRTADKHKTMGEKATKTINFDKIILDRLEEKARKENTSVSSLVNHFCRGAVMNDAQFYAEMAKIYYLKFQEFMYMKEQVIVMAEVKQN